MSISVEDPLTGEVVQWQPAGHTATEFSFALDSTDLLPKIGAFGTCGDPSQPDFSSWRTHNLFPAAERFGLDAEHDIFNPEVAEWQPDRALFESVQFARNQVLPVAVTNGSESPASVLEAGFGVYGGLRRGQSVLVSIQLDDETPEPAVAGRVLARDLLIATRERYPFFTMYEDVELLSLQACATLVQQRDLARAGVITHTRHTIPNTANNTQPAIYLSGTSGLQKPAWMTEVSGAIATIDHSVPVDESYREGWEAREHAAQETAAKLGYATQLVAITSQTESLGALAELGPRLMHADLAGQSIGVYIEPHQDSPANSRANRTRALATAHMERLLEDFPNAPLFIAKDLKQLALFGLSEHYRHVQRARALGNIS
jgi:hypothetical protein